MKSSYFAEITQSSLSSWQAQSWQWDYIPAFGSLVTLSTPRAKLFGIVHQIELGSSDPSRKPFAYQKTEQELIEEQPQIFEFLRTEFHIAPVAYTHYDALIYQLPLEPPKIHTFVAHASLEDTHTFFGTHQFLAILFGLSAHIQYLDELLLAMLQHSARLKLLTPQQFADFMQTFCLLANNDYQRVRLFAQRAQHNALLKELYV